MKQIIYRDSFGPKSLRTTVLKVSLEIEECFSTQLSEQWQSEFSHIVLFINNSQTQYCLKTLRSELCIIQDSLHKLSRKS